MRPSLLLHLLFFCAHKELCSSYGTRYADSIPQTVVATPPFQGSVEWRFRVSDENDHLTLTINTGFPSTRNCSNRNSIVTIKEGYRTRDVLCGDGVYESRGRDVTASIAGTHSVRITYKSSPSRSSDYQCIDDFRASPTTTFLRSTDIVHSSRRPEACRWSFYSRPGYNVRVRVLESNLTLPCSRNKISVYVENDNTLSWCGEKTPSFTSYHSTLVIRFNMSSIAKGHGFVISFTEVQEPNPEPIHSCESSFYADLESRTLKVNINTSSIYNVLAYRQKRRWCSITIMTSMDKEVQLAVRESSLPSPCLRHTVDIFEGLHQRTSWCENATPAFRSLGSSLTIWYNSSSVSSGSFTIDYHAVLRSSADVPHCDFIPLIYDQTNHLPSSKNAWRLCQSNLYATTVPRILTVTTLEFSAFPFYQRLTREWRIWSGRNRGVYVEIENNQNLRCSLGVIRIYDCEDCNDYRYLGSWCYGRNNTFRAASCLAVRFNATSLPSRSNTIFSLKYRNTDRWSYVTITRPPTPTWLWMTNRPPTWWPWMNNRPTTTRWPWMTNRPTTTRWPWMTNRPTTTRWPWINNRPTTTRWPWMTNRPPTTARNSVNHTMQPICSEVTRTVTSGIQSQVLIIPALSRVTCRWRLTASDLVDSENPIELKLKSRTTHMISSGACYDRYLEVFDGPSSSSPLLAKWCGLSNQTLVSTGHQVFLVYSGGYRYPWVSWSVHYKKVDDSLTGPASQTASSSSQTGTIVGSIFGVVLLVLAIAGALIAWRIYRRNNRSPYQNPITRRREAGISVFSVTQPSFSNAVYGQVKSPSYGKEEIKYPDTPETNDRPVFQQNEYMTLYQPLDATFPKSNVEDRSTIYDNHCNDGKDVSTPDNVYAVPHIYDRPEVNIYQDLPRYQPLNRSNVKGNVLEKSVTYDNLSRGANVESET